LEAVGPAQPLGTASAAAAVSPAQPDRLRQLERLAAGRLSSVGPSEWAAGGGGAPHGLAPPEWTASVHWLGPFARPEAARPAAESARQRASGPLPPRPEQPQTPAPPPNLGALACDLDALSCELDHLASTAGSGYHR